jgi:two-component system, NtrC family, response regulator HydG
MEKSWKAMIVDDEQEMRFLLRDFLQSKDFEVTLVSSATDAVKLLEVDSVSGQSLEFDLIISDIKMPGMNGLDFTSSIQASHPQIPIILITAFGSIETAIDAMRRGAFHYLVKPFKLTEVSVIVEKALQLRNLERQNSALRDALQKNWTVKGLIGKSPGMQNVFDLIHRVAPAQSNILINGESGTGKEMVATAIHEHSPRNRKPFVAINCAAIPETLLESELFGHAKGSFTGAIQRKRGLFEEAEGGTLFLDEIGDLSIALQAKLLRVLQEKKIRAVGENQAKSIDVRIIAATHKDLRKLIHSGLFREDLYYRLAVIPVSIPPLRQRKEDIPILANHFLKKYSSLNQSDARSFDPSALEFLISLPWAGNVRELENRVERATVLAKGKKVMREDLLMEEMISQSPPLETLTLDCPTIDELERRYIEKILQKTGGHKEQAAQILGINRRTLYRKEKEYGWVSGEGDGEHDEASDKTEPHD